MRNLKDIKFIDIEGVGRLSPPLWKIIPTSALLFVLPVSLMVLLFLQPARENFWNLFIAHLVLLILSCVIMSTCFWYNFLKKKYKNNSLYCFIKSPVAIIVLVTILIIFICAGLWLLFSLPNKSNEWVFSYVVVILFIHLFVAVSFLVFYIIWLCKHPERFKRKYTEYTGNWI